jgi:hypothetical protein
LKKQKKLIEKLELTVDNTRRYPWKWTDESVESVVITKLLEFIPGKSRPKFFEELYRILTVGGTALVRIPYWSSAGGIADYLYEWPPWTDDSFSFFNKEVRERLKMDRNIKCNFDYTGGYEIEGGIAQRAEETRMFAAKHYTNAIIAAQLTLTKKAN